MDLGSPSSWFSDSARITAVSFNPALKMSWRSFFQKPCESFNFCNVRRMLQRGWQAIEVSSGWYEVICRPQKWPIVSSRRFRSTRSSWNWEGWSVWSTTLLEVAISAAHQRVVQLETALIGPEVTMLQMALKRAKQAAQEPTRAQRHLMAHGEKRTRLVSVGRRPQSFCKVARGSNHRQGGSCATQAHPARVQRW